MNNNRKKVKTTLTVIVTLLLCIGFGLLASNLYLNSNLLLRRQNWNVHFENLIVKDGSVPTTEDGGAKIDVNNTSLITYSVAFDKPYDFYEFTVDIKNDGTVDTMVDNIQLKFNDQEIEDSSLPSYINYSVTYADGVEIESKQLLKTGSKETIKVRLYFENEITEEEFNSIPSEGISGYFTLTINYEQNDKTAINRNHNHSYYVSKILENSNNVEQVNISTTDHENELRFIGANPNNYVIFNNEASCDSNQENCTDVKWRIIGVFDGKLKLIRDSIGNYSWDTTSNANDAYGNGGYGVNQWGESILTTNEAYEGADLMRLLNPKSDGTSYTGINGSLYWTGGSGLCYSGNNNARTFCNFSSTGLTDTTSRNMIDDATWYLGSNLASINIWTNDNFNGPTVYTWERQTINLGKQCSSGVFCSDRVNRTPTWTGKVGLLYPSDYIYATSGGNTYNRDVCLEKSSGYSSGAWQNWDNTYTDCYLNDCLKSTTWYWFLSSRAHSSALDRVFILRAPAIVDSIYAYYACEVRPVVYLKSSVTITGGNGTQSSPYALN